MTRRSGLVATAAHGKTVAVTQIDVTGAGQRVARLRTRKREANETLHARRQLIAAQPKLEPIVESSLPVTARLQLKRRKMYTMTGEDTG